MLAGMAVTENSLCAGFKTYPINNHVLSLKFLNLEQFNSCFLSFFYNRFMISIAEISQQLFVYRISTSLMRLHFITCIV